MDDTIAAIATPIGQAGLAVVRLSGPQAMSIADLCFVPAGKTSLRPSTAPTHTIHFGHIVRSGQNVDEVLLSVMRAPRTFTREDVAEITCHGGILPAKLVLDALLASGARLAEAGEFTRRAFLNGRIDLLQAEAVADLIHSRTELALRAANEQLAGKLSHRINELRDQMLQTLAHIEAHIDFPEEDISPDTKDQLMDRLQHGIGFMGQLLDTADEGQILRHGIRAAIVGRPNAGKSSLLNQLLGRDRAIVSAIPGTTRDTIEETANIRGLPVILIDTAGLREARDEIEVEGVRRSRQSLEKAEFILHVFDSSQSLTTADETFLTEFSAKKRILVRNKIDLPPKLQLPDQFRFEYSQHAFGRSSAAQPFDPPTSPAEPSPKDCSVKPSPLIDVSCVTGQGIESLKDAIKDLVWSGCIRTDMLEVMINSRHQNALNRARSATLCTLESLRSGQSLELVAMDLRIAVNAIGEIVGKTSTEDLLDSIFSQFCIGK